MSNSIEHFSSKVANYIKYRPSYPQQIIEQIMNITDLCPAAKIADIGAGTGIFTQLLLENNFSVTAIEPNRYMLAAAKENLSVYPFFTYLNNKAEDTGLTSQSLDLIVAAQSFHWFNNDTTKQEFRRILKTNGYLALIWNQADLTDHFQQQLDQALQTFAVDYNKVKHSNLSAVEISHFFQANTMKEYCLDNPQAYDLLGLLGRIESCSYCPENQSTAHLQLTSALEKLFYKHANNNLLNIAQTCKLYIGRLNV